MTSILESAHQTFPNYFFAAGAVIMAVVEAIVLVVELNSIFDVYDIHGLGRAYKFYGALAICLILGMLLLLIGVSDDARITANNKQEWRRFEKAVSADSGYTFYYHGQAVSGAAIGIDKNNIGDYEIKYDPANKTVIIRDSQK